MSAAHSRNPGSELAGLKMTAEEFFALGETHERYELIEGVVVMSPSRRPRHWKVIDEVAGQLRDFVRDGGVADVYGETDLQIGDFGVFRPDLCAYASGPSEQIPERLTLPPDLVIEVLSPGTQAMDLITKKDEYQKRGIKEYWVIDPAQDASVRVRAWRHERDRFIEFFVEGDQLASSAIPGFTLDLRRLNRALGGR